MGKLRLAFLAVLCLVLLACGDNAQPVPKYPITITAVPRQTQVVKRDLLMGTSEGLVGYRIMTDDYEIVPFYACLRQADDFSTFGGLMVPPHVKASFAEVVEVVEEAKKRRESVTFYGDLFHLSPEDGGGVLTTPDGKKAILLYSATWRGVEYEVDLRPKPKKAE